MCCHWRFSYQERRVETPSTSLTPPYCVNPMSTEQIEGCNEILVGGNSIYLYNAVYFYLSFCFSSHRSAVLPLLMFSYAVNTVTRLILFHIDTHCQLHVEQHPYAIVNSTFGRLFPKFWEIKRYIVCCIEYSLLRKPQCMLIESLWLEANLWRFYIVCFYMCCKTVIKAV
jgi:hypothetical protein